MSPHSTVKSASCAQPLVHLPEGIRVNSINPDAIDNAFQTRIEKAQSKVLGLNVTEQLNANIPLKRHANPEEIAGTALFLASNLSAYVTGRLYGGSGLNELTRCGFLQGCAIAQGNPYRLICLSEPALAAGRGGIAAVSEATGVARSTIGRGQDELRGKQAGLNKGEAAHNLKRAVFLRERGEIRDCSFDSQAFRASGLNLVVSAIVHWNAVYLGRATAHLRQRGRYIDNELPKHVSPPSWEHIIHRMCLRGDLHFDPAAFGT